MDYITLTAIATLSMAGYLKGASQMAGLTFICSPCFWAFSASHVGRYWELHLVLKAVSATAFASGLVWSLYMAIEPPVRRNWPDSLISWTRLQRHRLRDPLVASHVLAGTLFISAFMVLRLVRFQTSSSATPRHTKIGMGFKSARSMLTPGCLRVWHTPSGVVPHIYPISAKGGKPRRLIGDSLASRGGLKPRTNSSRRL